jgi:hypothetical protein
MSVSGAKTVELKQISQQIIWFQLYRFSSTKGHKADKLVSIEQF